LELLRERARRTGYLLGGGSRPDNERDEPRLPSPTSTLFFCANGTQRITFYVLYKGSIQRWTLMLKGGARNPCSNWTPHHLIPCNYGYAVACTSLNPSCTFFEISSFLCCSSDSAYAVSFHCLSLSQRPRRAASFSARFFACLSCSSIVG
jgi:hypothetical protein